MTEREAFHSCSVADDPTDSAIDFRRPIVAISFVQSIALDAGQLIVSLMRRANAFTIFRLSWASMLRQPCR